jgi:DNA-binding NarL/FixJ family response regulator
MSSRVPILVSRQGGDQQRCGCAWSNVDWSGRDCDRHYDRVVGLLSVPLSILLALDDVAQCEQLTRAVDSSPSLCLVAVTSQSSELVELIWVQRPAVAVIDLHLSVVEGARLFQSLGRQRLATQVLFLCPDALDHVSESALLPEGVGLLPRGLGAEEMVGAILEASSGGNVDVEFLSPTFADRSDREIRPRARLSAREVEVLKLSSDGKSAKQIAHVLGVSHATITTLLARASEKLGTSGKTHAVAAAIRNGLL